MTNEAAACREAGADILFVKALLSAPKMRAIPQRIDAPHLIHSRWRQIPERSLSELGAIGYTLALYVNAPLQAAIAGIQKILRALYVRRMRTSVGVHLYTGFRTILLVHHTSHATKRRPARGRAAGMGRGAPGKFIAPVEVWVTPKPD